MLTGFSSCGCVHWLISHARTPCDHAGEAKGPAPGGIGRGGAGAGAAAGRHQHGWVGASWQSRTLSSCKLPAPAWLSAWRANVPITFCLPCQCAAHPLPTLGCACAVGEFRQLAVWAQEDPSRLDQVRRID